ncbi:MAG TPA: hypothetical protein VKR06_09735 [Ktedonosporobacter sp.]|nr:hypothetical protein [Ktedonosporobacter sp.]
MTDPSSAIGTWYLNEDYRGSNDCLVTVSIICESSTNGYTGTLINGDGSKEPLDAISWDDASSVLEFRRHGQGFWRWYRGRVVEGILVGRYAHSTDSEQKPAQLTDYACHVSGWNSDYLDQDIVPRSYDLVLNNDARARLRLDRDEDGGYIGRFKVYSGPDGEELEHDLEVTSWDGATISFTRHAVTGAQTFTGVASSRSITGTFTQPGISDEVSWHGVRTAVLGYGLVKKAAEERTSWQERTRRQLCHLMMAGNPEPLTCVAVVQEAPVEIPSDWGRRDDNPDAWPRDYRLFEVFFEYTLPNPYGDAPLARRAHGYLTTPRHRPESGKSPAIVALNGHSGSAWKMMHRDSDDRYWYGESFARRGYVVLALDVSHRPLEDHADLYPQYRNGDDPKHGNGAHPAVKAEGVDSDWEETGERAWDAMRALDYLLTRPEVDANAVVVTGLSMGGETATIAMGLDTRFALGVLAGFAPDLDVEFHHNNHPCWRWLHANIREYLDISDCHALAAPRPLIVQTGKLDATYSDFTPPFAADKQTVRRSRAAYGDDVDKLLHHLHYDAHRYHVGDFDPSNPTAKRGLHVPVTSEQAVAGALDWQTDDTTAMVYTTLFEAIDDLLAER